MNNQTGLSLVYFFYSSLLSLVALLSTASAGDTKLPRDLISPQTGAICNENAQVCYDDLGVSIGITNDVMGQQAADILTRKLAVVDKKYFDATNFNPVQGVSCHTLERACYEGDTINSALSTALFGSKAGKYEPEVLIAVPWAWDGSRYNNDTEIRATDDREYRLSFQADGSLQIQADCNRVLGSYNATGKSMTIKLGPSTMMACPPGSQNQQFLKDLDGVAGWLLKKGDLYLDIKFDTGTMRFYRGVAL